MAVATKKSTRTKKNNQVKKTTFSKETYLQWYEVMLRVRRFEERALMAYSQQKIRGFCHVYIGQEAIAAGISSALGPEDKLVTAYRQHGIALALGLSFAFLYGRVVWPCGRVCQGQRGVNALLF